MKIAGLDIGTTGCKLTVFDESGAYLDRAYQDYPISRGVTENEIDATGIMKAVLKVLKSMATKYPDISGIGVTSFGETCVLTDGEGTPLHRAMLYTDPRGQEECERLTEQMGGKTIASITGVKPHEMYSLPKAMWLKKYRPELYANAKHLFLMEDFVVFHLTGYAQIDFSLASRTMGFDIMALRWSEELFRMANIDMGLMSEPVPGGTPAGRVQPWVAKATGLSQEAQVVSIGHDQVAAAVGAGVFDTEQAVDGAGTVECITPVYDTIPKLNVMYKGNFAVVPYVIPGKYVAYAFSYTGGALIQWCVDTLAKQEKELAKKRGISVNELLEEEYTRRRGSGPSKLLVLPHFAGAATPYMDTGSRGAILGLTASSAVSDIYRGCMEGVVYEMLVNMEYLKESGVSFTKLHATGGGARSQVWMQMKADMLNLPITALRTVDAGTVGSAILTGMAVGAFRDLADGAAHMVEKTRTYEPDPEMHEKYMEIYQRYRRLYQAVRPLM